MHIRCRLYFTLRPNHFSSTSGGFQGGLATLVYLSLSDMAPAYLAADFQLASDEGRRQLHSATSRTCVVRRTYSN